MFDSTLVLKFTVSQLHKSLKPTKKKHCSSVTEHRKKQLKSFSIHKKFKTKWYYRFMF